MIVWQELTPEQFASVREARLGGALGAIVGGAAGLAAIGGVASAWELLVGQTPILFQAQLWIPVAWAIVFVAMTLARSPSAPSVSSGLLVGCIALRAIMTVAGYARISLDVPGSLLAAQFAYLLFECVFAAAFWGYMRKGIRPNLYYRRRIPIVQPG